MFALLALKKEGWDLSYLEDRFFYDGVDSLERMLETYEKKGLTPSLFTLTGEDNQALILKGPLHLQRMTRLLFNREPFYEALEETFKTLGFNLENKEEIKVKIHFKDLGALVFYMNLFKEDLPEFDLKIHQEKILELQKEIDQGGSIELQEHYHIYTLKRAAV